MSFIIQLIQIIQVIQTRIISALKDLNDVDNVATVDHGVRGVGDLSEVLIFSERRSRGNDDSGRYRISKR